MSLSAYEPDLCIYHADCLDGFGAAWAIWKRWPDCAFVPGTYGKPLPDVTGKHVLFVDFSAPAAWIAANAARARSVVLIDHHRTAWADLAQLPPFDGSMAGLEAALAKGKVAAWFDMVQSGAAMAWQFASEIPRADADLPEMIALIEDRDLWLFARGVRTKAFAAGLGTYPMRFETWERLSQDVESVVAEGMVVLKAHRVVVRRLVAEAWWEDVGGHVVPVVNAPYQFASDVGHALLERHPDAAFAASWFRRGDGVMQWSLRSEDGRVDVSVVAKALGGGGHRNASGFEQAWSARAQADRGT